MVKKLVMFVLISTGLLFLGSSNSEGEEGLYFKEDFEGESLNLVEWAGDHKKTIEKHELSKEIFHSGKQSEHLKIVYEGGGSDFDYWKVRSIGNVNLTPGMMLEVSAWVKANSPVNIAIGHMPNGSTWNGVISGGDYRGTGEWEEIKFSNIENNAFSQTESFKQDTSKGMIILGVSFNFLGWGPHDIDVYIDDVKVYSRIPMEIENIEKEKEKIKEMLKTEEGKKYEEEFNKFYIQLDVVKDVLYKEPEGSEQRIEVQKRFKDILNKYKELKNQLTFAVLE